MSNPKISVLVPIYNVEDFLPECLDSLCGQTLKDIEIVCINDGSTDTSLEIAKEYRKKDNRIIIIDKPNSGYGDSMNKGLERATGEYIGIVEPDDWIDKNAFDKLYRIAKKDNLEVVKANFYEYFTKSRKDVSKSEMFIPEDEGKVINPREHRTVFYGQPSIWSAIYKNDFLKTNGIKFLPTPGASYQDAGFSFKVWSSASRVMLLNEAFLHYRQDNPNSSVKSDGKIYAVKDEYDEIERFLKEKGLLEEYGSTLATMRLSAYIWNMKRLTKKAALEFSKTAKEDYNRLKKEGYLDKGKLDGVGTHNAKNLAVKHPRLYIAIRPLHESRNRLRTFTSKTIKTIFPSYKQRLHTIDLVKELKENQAELEAKIEQLEEAQKEKKK